MSLGEQKFEELEKKAFEMAVGHLNKAGAKPLNQAELAVLHLGIGSGLRVIMEELERLSKQPADHFAE